MAISVQINVFSPKSYIFNLCKNTLIVWGHANYCGLSDQKPATANNMSARSQSNFLVALRCPKKGSSLDLLHLSPETPHQIPFSMLDLQYSMRMCRFFDFMTVDLDCPE